MYLAQTEQLLSRFGGWASVWKALPPQPKKPFSWLVAIKDLSAGESTFQHRMNIAAAKYKNKVLPIVSWVLQSMATTNTT